jgi:hypothetical protein
VFAAARHRSRGWRHVFLTLAALALAVKVLIPPGYMAAPAASASPFPLVLCTGQGLTIVHGDALGGAEPGNKAPTPKSPHDAPCSFAGHGTAGPAPGPQTATLVEFVAYRSPPVAGRRDLAPGRGLAAPPLPARGPPV